MMQKSTPCIEIVKREDKEAKLVQFVRDCVVNSGDTGITVVARSFDSPVVRALATVLGESNAAVAEVRIILAIVDGAENRSVAIAGVPSTVRWARQPRLADAHEQLVLTATATWIGDCMRRDPAKRDAYECFTRDSRESVRWATLAFERLWTHSEPFVAAQPPVIVADDVCSADDLPHTSSIAADAGEPAPIASTRH